MSGVGPLNHNGNGHNGNGSSTRTPINRWVKQFWQEPSLPDQATKSTRRLVGSRRTFPPPTQEWAKSCAANQSFATPPHLRTEEIQLPDRDVDFDAYRFETTVITPNNEGPQKISPQGAILRTRKYSLSGRNLDQKSITPNDILDHAYYNAIKNECPSIDQVLKEAAAHKEVPVIDNAEPELTRLSPSEFVEQLEKFRAKNETPIFRNIALVGKPDDPFELGSPDGPKLDLSGVVIQDSVLQWVKVSNCDFKNSLFENNFINGLGFGHGTELADTQFISNDIDQVYFHNSKELAQAKFIGNYIWDLLINPQSEDCRGSTFIGNCFIDCDLSEKVFSGSDFFGSKFYKCSLDNSKFRPYHKEIKGQEKKVPVTTNFGMTEMIKVDCNKSNFTEANFFGAKLSKVIGKAADFTRANLGHSVLRNSEFLHSNFQGARLQARQAMGCKFNNSNMRNLNAKASKFNNCQFKYCKLDKAQFDSASLPKCDFKQASYQGNVENGSSQDQCVSFSSADLQDASFEKANLPHANFEKALFEKTNLNSGTFNDANFAGSTWKGVEAKKTTLTNANFGSSQNQDCYIFKSTISGSDLSNATFNGTKLIANIFDLSNFSQAEFNGSSLEHTQADKANFTEAKFGKLGDKKFSNITNSRMRGADFTKARFNGVDITECDFLPYIDPKFEQNQEEDIPSTDTTSTSFIEAHFQDTVVYKSYLPRVDMSNSKAHEVEFTDCFMPQCILDDANWAALIIGSNLNDGSFKEANFRGCISVDNLWQLNGELRALPKEIKYDDYLKKINCN